MKLTRDIVLEGAGTILGGGSFLASIVAFNIWGSNEPSHALLHPTRWLAGAALAFVTFGVTAYFTVRHYEVRKEAECNELPALNTERVGSLPPTA
jgi:hypothetical protein